MKIPKVKLEPKKLVQPLALLFLAAGFIYGVHQLAVSHDLALYIVVLIATLGLVNAVNSN